MKYLIVNSMDEHIIDGRRGALDISGSFFRLDSTRGSVEVYKITRRGLKLIKHWERKCQS